MPVCRHQRLHRRVDGHPGPVKRNFWIGLLAATALIFGAAATHAVDGQAVYFGDVANDHVKALTDHQRREFADDGDSRHVHAGDGVYPKPFTDVMHVSVTGWLMQHVGVEQAVIRCQR